MLKRGYCIAVYSEGKKHGYISSITFGFSSTDISIEDCKRRSKIYDDSVTASHDIDILENTFQTGYTFEVVPFIGVVKGSETEHFIKFLGHSKK